MARALVPGLTEVMRHDPTGVGESNARRIAPHVGEQVVDSLRHAGMVSLMAPFVKKLLDQAGYGLDTGPLGD